MSVSSDSSYASLSELESMVIPKTMDGVAVETPLGESGEGQPQEANSEADSIMSQWAKVQQRPAIFQHMRQYYPPNFPIEMRYYLCGWIEEQKWNEIDESNQQYASLAQKILSEMLELLRHRASEMTSQDFFIIKIKLDELVLKLDGIVKTNPLELVQVIKTCLNMEKNLIEQAEQEEQQNIVQEPPGPEQNGIGEKIMQEIQSLSLRTTTTEVDLKNLQMKQESFILKFSDTQRIQAQIQQVMQMPAGPDKKKQEAELRKQKEEIDNHLGLLAQGLLKDRIELSRKYEQTILSLSDLQKEILDKELITWKRNQQMGGNGFQQKPDSLERLQQWCESLAELIWQNRHQMKKASQLQEQLPIKDPEGAVDMQPKLNDTITGLLSSLVTSTFIVEQQPPQVLKKDARFGAVVRLLVGGKLNVHMNPPQVKATIISENQAKDLLRNEVKAKDDTSGDILNNLGTMEYQSSNGQLSISFRNMQLKRIKRADKKGSELVTEEKFCILFQSEFSVGGNELVFQVWTLSLPVVVTVHGNQECDATATVLWDNAFAEPGRVPFHVPDQVAWQDLAYQLNMKFAAYTGKGLSETNLAYIASKLFGNKDPTQCTVPWALFNKDPLPGRTFTFWEWFYAIQKLTKEHLKDLWTDEAIIGFLSKTDAQDWLMGRPMGTFLLRFSDSEIGGITVAWRGDTEVWNLAPFLAKDFQIRGIADRIKDLPNLIYLYPDKHKDAVFSKYCTHASEPCRSDGYIRPHLRTTIPGPYAMSEQDLGQPFSPDQSHFSSNPGSVQPLNMDVPIEMDEVTQSLEGFDFTDYMPDDITDINLGELIRTHQTN